MKNIITISGIRPDFIRMSEIFKKLDANFNHTLIHSGQHYDALLSSSYYDYHDDYYQYDHYHQYLTLITMIVIIIILL